MTNNASKTVADLKRSLTLTVGHGNVWFADDDAARLLPYLSESRGRRMGRAFAVVFPTCTEEVAKVVATCHFHKVPIVTQGGNTGRCFGAQADDERAVIIQLKHLNRVRDFDPDNMTITVEAGMILQDVQRYVAERGYFFSLSLGAEGSCQIGGNLAVNAGGINVLRYGNARELTLGVEAVIANGTVLNALHGLRKNNTGYDLKNLLIGSEGTLGIITAATLKIFAPESNTSHAFIALASVEDAVTTLRRLQQRFEGRVSTFELLPNLAMTLMEQHSDVKCPLDNHHPWYVWYKLADSQITRPLRDEQITFLRDLQVDGLIIDAALAHNERVKQHFEHIRETIVEVQKHAGFAIKHDVSVPVSSIAQLIAAGNAAVQQACPNVRPYPFGHVGDGNIHYNLMCPEDMDDASFMSQYKDKLQKIILDIVDGLGGSFSAEHGIGSQKVELMQTYQDPVALDMMRRIKHAFDPFNLMNPGKVVVPR